MQSPYEDMVGSYRTIFRNIFQTQVVAGTPGMVPSGTSLRLLQFSFLWKLAHLERIEWWRTNLRIIII